MHWAQDQLESAAPIAVNVHVRGGTALRVRTNAPGTRDPYVTVEVGTPPAELTLFVTSVGHLDRIVAALDAQRPRLVRAEQEFAASLADEPIPAGSAGSAG